MTKMLEVYAFSRKKKQVSVITDSMPSIPDSIKMNEIPSNPILSVVIPAYIRNDVEKGYLDRLVHTLHNQSTPIQNIIVIDDCSPMDVVVPDNIQYIKVDLNGGPAKARNIGIEQSIENESDVVLFTDLDCVPNTDWSEAMVRMFLIEKKAHILSGMTKSYTKNWLGKYHEINGTLNGRVFLESNQLLYGPTCNLAITRDVAEHLRFDQTFPFAAGEDIDFCLRAIQSGFSIRLCANAIVKHDYGYTRRNVRGNIQSFMRQFERYAEGENILLTRNPEYYSYLELTEGINNGLMPFFPYYDESLVKY